jgi:drug/metabolite transporter (DMT)-like permease
LPFTPVTTLLLAWLLRKERLTRAKALAVVLALAGVLVLLSASGFDPRAGTFQGDLLCLGNATSFSLFLVLSPGTMRGLSVRAVTTLLFVLGSLGVGLYGWPSLRSLDWGAVDGTVWLTGLLIVLGPTVGAYFLNNWALARTESSRVALFIYLQFVLAAPLSWLLLDEKLTWRLLPAAGLVLAGLGFAVFTKPDPRHVPSQSAG